MIIGSAITPENENIILTHFITMNSSNLSILLWILRICYFCGSFQYGYDAKKNKFVFSKFAFLIFLFSCVCSAFSLSDVLLNFKMHGGFYSISRLITISMNCFMKLVMVANLKSKMKFYNKIIDLYLQEDSEASVSSHFFILYLVAILGSMSDYVHYWCNYDRLFFFWRLSAIPNRFYTISMQFQLVAVCVLLRKRFETLNRELKELLKGNTSVIFTFHHLPR